MIEQSCLDAGVTLFKHCMGKCHAKLLGIYLHSNGTYEKIESKVLCLLQKHDFKCL